MSVKQSTFIDRMMRGVLFSLAIVALGCAVSPYVVGYIHTEELRIVPNPDLVWFAPNMGSTDYSDLFTKPDQWPVARSKIDVFKFYTQNVFDNPCSICGNNILNTFVSVNAFQKLTDWGIAISIEVGAVKEWGCGTNEFGVADSAIQNIQANGGKVTFLAMDEPFIGGQIEINGTSCGFNMEQTAKATVSFVDQVKAKYPDMIVGDIEPYPYFSVSKLEQWIRVLEAKRLTPAFFHLDVDIEAVKEGGHDVASDLQSFSKFCEQHGIPFGVIFTSNWTAAGSDRGYYMSTLDWVHTVKDAIGRPPHVIFQSWQGTGDAVHKVPINLPESDAAIYSHTRLLVEGLTLLGQ